MSLHEKLTREEFETIVEAQHKIQRFPCDDEQRTKHYDNSNGSLYKFAEEQKLNAWEFDIIKRIVRCRKKGHWVEDLEKTIYAIELYKKEYKNEQ